MDSMTRDFFNRRSRPLTLRLCSCLLYLSIREVFKLLMYVFTLVGWESISINTHYLSLKWFCGSVLIGEIRVWRPISIAVLHFYSWSTTAWNNALPSLGGMTSHTSWYASSAFWKNSDFSGKEHFSQQSTWGSKCVILGFFYSISEAINARTEDLNWILDTSSRWSEILYFYAFVKRQHGWRSPHFIIDTVG